MISFIISNEKYNSNENPQLKRNPINDKYIIKCNRIQLSKKENQLRDENKNIIINNPCCRNRINNYINNLYDKKYLNNKILNDKVVILLNQIN